jgi:hypothetical protein
MNTFRIYRLDETGHIIGPPDAFEDITEEQAIELARQRIDGLTVELWKGATLVKRFDPQK